MALNFYDVFDIEEYQNIQDVFSKNMGIGSITTLPSGKPITRPSNFCNLCEKYIRKSKTGRSNCFTCNAEMGKQDSSGPIIKQCLNGKGLWNAGVSIVVNGNHIANWCIGQIKNEYVDESYFLTFAEEIGISKEDFRNALDKVPYMTKERFTQVANILFLFVNQYAEKACKNLMLKQQLQELKNTNEMLFRSQKRYRLLFEQSNDAIFVVKLPEGEYIDANEAASKLTGRTHDEIIKLRTKDLTPRGAEKRLQQAIGGKSKDKSYTVEYLKPDGDIRHANLSLIPIDQNSLYGIAKDITEQLEATEALKHSHNLMQYIIEHSRSAIAVHDKELRYIYVSHKYLEDYNIKKNQIIGKHHYEVFPHLPQKWRDVHQKALKGIVSSAEEDPYEKEDGSLEWTRWECRPWYDQNNEVGGIIVYTEVITERKNTEIKLRKSEEKFKFLFYSNPQPSWIYDLESLSFLEVNNAAIIHYGYTREEFLSMTLKDIRPKEDILKLLDEITNKIKPEYSNGEQWRHLKKNGEIIHVNVSSHAIEYLGKQARHVLINDITDRIKAEHELRKALEKAKESDRLKSAFLANMSHEIRTPLNSLLGFSELLIDPSFDKSEKKEFVETMKLSENRLLSLIDDIVDLSKMESGQIQVDKHSILLGGLLDSVHRIHLKQANKKGLKLVFNRSGLENEISITSDRARLTQILNKLLGNAIKFTERGSIELGLHLLENSIQFYVKDTGIGIDSKFHTRIFERFWQVDSGLKRKYEGSGIGLTVAKNLVELLGGNIGLDSKVGVGSTFYFTIPFMPND